MNSFLGDMTYVPWRAYWVGYWTSCHLLYCIDHVSHTLFLLVYRWGSSWLNLINEDDGTKLLYQQTASQRWAPRRESESTNLRISHSSPAAVRWCCPPPGRLAAALSADTVQYGVACSLVSTCMRSELWQLYYSTYWARPETYIGVWYGVLFSKSRTSYTVFFKTVCNTAVVVCT